MVKQRKFLTQLKLRNYMVTRVEEDMWFFKGDATKP